MKKISSTFANNHEFINRPFALVNHEHVEYIPLDANAPITVTSPLIFEGAVLLDGANAGIQTVADTTERDAILATIREEGMLVFVQADSTTYQLVGGTTNGDWTVFVGGGEVLYTNATPMPEALGGLPQGRTFASESIDSILDNLLYPYVAISTSSLSADIGNGLREKGNTITATINFTANYTLGSDPLVDITFKRGGLTQQVDTINTWSETVDVADTTTFSVDVNDGTTVASRNRTYTFVYPFYYGVGAPALTPAQIRSNFGVTITSSGDKTYGFNPAGEVYYFAYPASYGTLTRVLDWNGFDITGDFTLRTENLTGLDATSQSYHIYEFNNLVTHASQNLTFDT